MSNSKALKDGEYKDLICCLVEGVPNQEQLDREAVCSHLGAKGLSHTVIRMVLSMKPQEAIDLLKAEPSVVASRASTITTVRAECMEMRKLTLPESFNPSDFPGLGKGWDYWKGPLDGDGVTGKETWIDPRAAAMTEFDPTKMIFKTCLKEQEKSIKGFEKFRRLVEEEADFIRYDLRFFFSLWEDCQRHKENSILEMLYQTQKIEFPEFMVPLRDPDGFCCVLFFCRRGYGEWYWGCLWLGSGWGARGHTAGCASSPRNLESLSQ